MKDVQRKSILERMRMLVLKENPDEWFTVMRFRNILELNSNTSTIRRYMNMLEKEGLFIVYDGITPTGTFRFSARKVLVGRGQAICPTCTSVFIVKDIEEAVKVFRIHHIETGHLSLVYRRGETGTCIL